MSLNLYRQSTGHHSVMRILPRTSLARLQRTALPARQRGSALIIGVFVITVMFLLASALINIVEDGDTGLTQEVWGTRALAAANSGADAALAQLFPLNGAVGVCSANSAWAPPDVVGFHACSVTLQCTRYFVGSFSQYHIKSQAVCESGDTRVSRQVEVEARGN
ncbi:MAG: MSHA biogenesis protein MshP [Shewanella sp.]|uniref:MSHA biogenesis protein MshP n=1 Tax=unclassified Shewanella TaxID=196818 RepID=UPI0021D877CB|nr:MULTISPECIES: MSHA biogenesis protein MshP [unclassified Shewanella]MCU8009527.1 MSHA biogenesis protein MshP [Shewanella sp. SM87]MCU8036751.1 MSHA biogenesis protein MshP [Shewanella sp. SM71]MCU8057378.1 MSHA biogenesis protein MshP [Shewanella sp. SM35]MCU8067224.1 MSHA biogenesis protein MshP [Shewanella sp. SM34]MCU8098238.1 MSHA biogenesis protein MshP [Shewanella sp. SM102]